MNKKFLFLSVLLLTAACTCKKTDYIILDHSEGKKPVWVSDIRKYEKKKDNEADKYKYFKAEGISPNLRLCERNAINNTNVSIAGEISTEIDNLYTGATSVQNEEFVTDTKKESSKMLIKNKLSGVEPKEGYWEKRKYSMELGADKDKIIYYCYQLSRINRKTHETIVNEMINKKIKMIKDEDKKGEFEEKVKENVENSNINLNIE